MSATARLVERRTFQTPGKLEVTELFFSGIPLDWSNHESGEIQLFARSVRKAEKPMEQSRQNTRKELPWLLYLEGGPGFGCSSPQNWPATETLLERGYQLLFLDHRGTGLSSALSASMLDSRGGASTQVEYLKLFRADSIVKDCEAVRKCLTSSLAEEQRQWSILGHSFGGFCCVTYLSLFPEALVEVFVDAGLPPLVDSPDSVYERLYQKVVERNHAFYQKFPEDVQRVKRIVSTLQDEINTISLPSGGAFTARRFQQLGMNLGFHGGVDEIHELILEASNDLALFGHLTRPTLNRFEQSLPFDDHIIYAVLHEPIYCQGNASNWSAERLRKKFPQFELNTDGPLLFTGEMIYPWMFDDYVELRKLKGAAQIIAECASWPRLYDEKQLAQNTVPVYAAVFQEDMFVDYTYSRDTASKIRNCKIFTTNMMYHNALRTTASSKMDEVLKALFALRDDVID